MGSAAPSSSISVELIELLSYYCTKCIHVAKDNRESFDADRRVAVVGEAFIHSSSDGDRPSEDRERVNYIKTR